MSKFCQRFKTAWVAGWRDVESAKWHRARSRALLIRARETTRQQKGKVEL